MVHARLQKEQLTADRSNFWRLQNIAWRCLFSFVRAPVRPQHVSRISDCATFVLKKSWKRPAFEASLAANMVEMDNQPKIAWRRFTKTALRATKLLCVPCDCINPLEWLRL
ncbi:MAG: hypothetical protein DMF08_08455 [Verrucomicrobia bacterium]|nr:MAG: hypothetical protein DMF08_08455 [Verrucomicrobiota bacterium]